MPWFSKQPDLKNNPLYLEPRVGAVESSVAQKASKTDLNNIVNGSPKEVFPTLSALQIAYPTGSTGVYVVSVDGKWYFWNGSAWTPGGIYQATGVGDVGYKAHIISNTDPKSYLLFKFNTGETYTASNVTRNYRVKFTLKNLGEKITELGIGRASVTAASTLTETTLNSPSTRHKLVQEKGTIANYDLLVDGFILNSTYSSPTLYIYFYNIDLGLTFTKEVEITNLKITSEDGLTTYTVDKYGIFNNSTFTPDTYVVYKNLGNDVATKDYVDVLTNGLATTNYVDTKVGNIKIDTYFSTKKWGFVGDSITQGWDNTQSNVATPYPTTVSQLLGLSSFVNYGIAGSTVARSIKNPIVDRMTSLATDLDIISVFAGTNDWGHGDTTVQRPLGTIDSTDVTTFYGALNSICNYLITNFPTKLVFLATPLHREGENTLNSHGLKLVDYVNAIRAIGQKFSIPVLDLYNTGNLYPDNATHKAQLIKDGVHPTQWYYTNVLARKFAGFVKTII